MTPPKIFESTIDVLDIVEIMMKLGKYKHPNSARGVLIRSTTTLMKGLIHK